MPSVEKLRESLSLAKRRLREAEDSLLAERQRAQELRAAYRETQTVRPETMPMAYIENRGL